MWRAAVWLVWIAPWLCAQQGTTVEGTVINSVTHAGLGGVSVTFSAYHGGQQYNTTTDASGAYRITNVQPGSYGTEFQKTGFLEPPRPGPFEPGLRIAPAQNGIRLDQQLTPLATLRGRVVDPEGQAVSGVEVGISEFVTSETGSDGEFVLTEIPPGSYTLFAKPKPAAAVVKDGKHTGSAITFYPDATDPAQAQLIAVHGGDDLAGLDIRLRASPAYRVRGTVVNRSGQPAPHADVSLRSVRGARLIPVFVSQEQYHYYLTGGTQFLQEADVETDDHGRFELPSVRPGQWVVRVESQPAPDGLTMTGGAALSVSEKDIDDWQIPFSSPFTLRGTADWGDQPPPDSSRQAGVMLFSEESGAMGARLGAVSGESLVVEGLTAGRYRIVPMPSGPAGYYAASVFLGEREVGGESVELTPDSPPPRVVYKPNAGSVRGTVQGGPGATVLLWRQPAETADLVLAATCDARGVFQFGSVPPGDYSVLAFDRVNTAGDSDTFLRNSLPAAARASVGESSAATVELQVNHWPD